MPATAVQHFQKDIARVRAIVAHAMPLARTSDAERVLRDDLFRSAWRFAVGALDAYYCDAYADLIAVTASSKARQPSILLSALTPLFSRHPKPMKMGGLAVLGNQFGVFSEQNGFKKSAHVGDLVQDLEAYASLWDSIR